MTALDRRTMLATGLSLLFGGGAQAFSPPDGFAVEDIEYERTATIHGPMLSSANHTQQLVSVVDKATGRATDTIVVQVRYKTYNTLKIDAASTGRDQPLAVSRQGALPANCPVGAGCVVSETVTIALPGNVMTAQRDQPLAIRLRGPGGDFGIALEVEALKAQQRTVQGYKQSIGK